MLRIGFIGCGTVGTALACSLNQYGYTVRAVSSLRHESDKILAASIPGCRPFLDNQQVADNADMVFITTPDDVVPAIAGSIRWKPGQFVLHCSGADSSEILKPAADWGAYIGVFHPLQTFAYKDNRSDKLAGITFAIEAQKPLLDELVKMVALMESNYVIIKPSDKVLYHASAVIASNYLVTLAYLSGTLWQHFGKSMPDAMQALLPLIKGTVANIESKGFPDCLSGPIARGDAGTVKKHLQTLKRDAPAMEAVYRELGLNTIPIALAKGRIDAIKARELEDILRDKGSEP